MRQYLERNFKDYPKSTIKDYLKYVFQMYEGPKHLLTDKNRLFQNLKDEIHSLTEYNGFENLYDPVGPRFVRINLRPYRRYQLDSTWLFNAFSISQNQESLGSINCDDFKSFLKEKGFSPTDISSALLEYQERGTPLSHSPQYHQFYRPSYRLISRSLITTEMKIIQIQNFLSHLKGKLRFIAVDGKSASGKTTLLSDFQMLFPTTVIHADDFFDNSNNEIGVNSDRIKTEILDRAVTKQSLTYQKYDCKLHEFKEITIPVIFPLIVEGSYSANKILESAYDLIIFMDIDHIEQRRRLEKRSKPLLKKFINSWIPRENKYFEKENIIQKADLIV